MITEDYVSFETAKLLKEKGFDECPLFRYDDCGELWVQGGYNKTIKWHFPAPTLQMAMKWLRKIHKLFIQIEISPFDGIFYVNIFKKEDFWISANNDTSMVYTGETIFTKDFNTPEQACEAAIKYCLENLI